MNLRGLPFKRSKPAKTMRADKPYDWGRDDITPGKGKRNGNCNRMSCQAPLMGREQWYMRSYGTTNGRLYYCGRCAQDFNASDKQFNQEQRCTLDVETGD